VRLGVCAGAFANSLAADADAANVHPIIRCRCRTQSPSVEYPSSVAADAARAAASVVSGFVRSCEFCCGGDGGRCASAGRNCCSYHMQCHRGSGLMLLAPRPLRLCPCSKGGGRVERSGGGSRGGVEWCRRRLVRRHRYGRAGRRLLSRGPSALSGPA
jgi:hypothetical protein